MSRPSAFHFPGFGERALTRAELAKMDPWEAASYLASRPEAEREADGWRKLKAEDAGLSDDEALPGTTYYDDGPGEWSSGEGGNDV